MFAELAETAVATIPALVGAARTVTYGQLDERGNRVANALRDLGVGEDERVAYLDLNNPEFFEVMLGAARIGAAIAPLNFRLTPTEMGRIVHDAGADGAGRRAGVRGRAARDPGRGARADAAWCGPARTTSPGSAAAERRGPGPRVDVRRRGAAALHLGHHRAAQGRACSPTPTARR